MYLSGLAKILNAYECVGFSGLLGLCGPLDSPVSSAVVDQIPDRESFRNRCGEGS
jgi:hypothetical protein